MGPADRDLSETIERYLSPADIRSPLLEALRNLRQRKPPKTPDVLFQEILSAVPVDLIRTLYVARSEAETNEAIRALRHEANRRVRAKDDQTAAVAIAKVRELEAAHVDFCAFAAGDDFSRLARGLWERAVIKNIIEWGGKRHSASANSLRQHAECFATLTDNDRRTLADWAADFVDSIQSIAAGAPSADTIIMQADGCFRIGTFKPIRLEVPEAEVLKAFLGKSALTSQEIRNASKHEYPHVTLRRLEEKYDGRFRPAIHRPGGKGKGGYSLKIQRES